jgi:hypothetical protein
MRARSCQCATQSLMSDTTSYNQRRVPQSTHVLFSLRELVECLGLLSDEVADACPEHLALRPRSLGRPRREDTARPIRTVLRPGSRAAVQLVLSLEQLELELPGLLLGLRQLRRQPAVLVQRRPRAVHGRLELPHGHAHQLHVIVCHLFASGFQHCSSPQPTKRSITARTSTASSHLQLQAFVAHINLCDTLLGVLVHTLLSDCQPFEELH